MGNPKQKWTPEEESALKAGICKHGAGKWSAILKDPEFSSTLFSRSNVDLKDKWRNLRVIPTGRGCREKAVVTVKKANQMTNVGENLDDMIVDAKPLAVSVGPLHVTASTRSEAKLETLIVEAIINSKDPLGSNRTSISMYIEEHSPPSEFKVALSGKLKEMIEAGKLIKVKHNYRIAPSSVLLGGRSSKVLPAEERQRDAAKVERAHVKHLNKPQIDAELARMECMTAKEAAAVAAQAVAEAEVAMIEAEEAMRRAEAAEAEAEEAEVFMEATSLLLKDMLSSKMV